MDDLINLIGGHPRLYVRCCDVQDFTTGLRKRCEINDKGGNEGYGNDGTLQTSLILSCSSALRILGGCPEAFLSPRGTPDGLRLGPRSFAAKSAGVD